MKVYSPEELKKMKVVELRRLSKEHHLIGTSQLRKADLVERLTRHMSRLAESDGETADPKQPAHTAMLRTALHEPSAAGTSSTKKTIDAPEPATSGPAATEAPPQEDPGRMRDPDWYPPELPERYGVDRLTLMVRDPHWLFCYWEVNEDLVAATRAEMSGPSWKVLRIHLLGEDESVLDGWEHGLPESATSWYVHTGRPGALFRAELGLTDMTGRYRRLIGSNIVRAPMDAPSERWDEEWIGLSRETWERLEREARPFPGSLAGIELLRREMKALAAMRLGASEFAASRQAGSQQAKKAFKP